MLADIAKKAGLPDGVLNVIQGGKLAGEALVANEMVSLISFTGSTSVGRSIAQVAGQRLARVSLELGGKNAMVICDDADMDQAIHWAAVSAFSNAGQRCAAASRLIVFKNIYDVFVKGIVDRAKVLKLGVTEGCDLGPVISLQEVLANIESDRGGRKKRWMQTFV